MRVDRRMLEVNVLLAKRIEQGDTSFLSAMIFDDPFVQKEIVVAWRFEVFQVLSRLMGGKESFEGATSCELVLCFDENSQIIRCEDVENVLSCLLEARDDDAPAHWLLPRRLLRRDSVERSIDV